MLGVRGAERKGQALYYFVFQIENLLLAQFMTSRSPARHILFPSVGETQGPWREDEQEARQVNNFVIDGGVLACARGQF